MKLVVVTAFACGLAKAIEEATLLVRGSMKALQKGDKGPKEITP